MVFEYQKNTPKSGSKRPRPVRAKSIDTGEVFVFCSIVDAGRTGGFIPQIISRCCSGKQKTHAGFTFEYID